MYKTCLHCHAPLGANATVEHFAIGRRLAFDAAKGRLWVVCPSCRRWNLTPIEERWEAIEDCEKAFRATTSRASTDNISVAKTKEGLALVRIGKPLAPEMAAWRYGRELERRWLTRGVPSTAGLIGMYALQTVVQGQLVPIALGLGIFAMVPATAFIVMRRQSRVRLAMPDGRVKTIHSWTAVRATRWKTRTARIVTLNDGTWGIRYGEEPQVATGHSGVHFLRGMLTALNYLGARRKRVEEATTAIAAAGGSERFVERLVSASTRVGADVINELPQDLRLALEMALHEDSERRAIEGDMSALLEEWKLAESIAAIADDMFLPASVIEGHARLKAAT